MALISFVATSFRIKKLVLMNLREHFFVLHLLFSLDWPSHGLPPFRASSFIDLSRYWKPPPHFLSHFVHWEKSFHTQSTFPSEIWIFRKLKNEFIWISLNVRNNEMFDLMIFYLPLLFTSKPLEDVPAFGEIIRIRRYKNRQRKGGDRNYF